MCLGLTLVGPGQDTRTTHRHMATTTPTSAQSAAVAGAPSPTQTSTSPVAVADADADVAPVREPDTHETQLWDNAVRVGSVCLTILTQKFAPHLRPNETDNIVSNLKWFKVVVGVTTSDGKNLVATPRHYQIEATLTDEEGSVIHTDKVPSSLLSKTGSTCVGVVDGQASFVLKIPERSGILTNLQGGMKFRVRFSSAMADEEAARTGVYFCVYTDPFKILTKTDRPNRRLKQRVEGGFEAPTSESAAAPPPPSQSVPPKKRKLYPLEEMTPMQRVLGRVTQLESAVKELQEQVKALQALQAEPAGGLKKVRVTFAGLPPDPPTRACKAPRCA